jgi:hypothetical protein
MKDNFDKIFIERKNEFDLEEPNFGHFDRFEAKLKANKNQSKSKKTNWHWLTIAASVLLFFGYWLGNYNANEGLELADVSPKMEETQGFYMATIHKEIQEIKKQETPQNKQIIDDAFMQLEKLENNYQKLTLELKESNEDKRVIYAMISNFQNRLEVLQNLVDQLEEFENLIPEENRV